MTSLACSLPCSSPETFQDPQGVSADCEPVMAGSRAAGGWKWEVRSAAMQRLHAQMERIAPYFRVALVTGEAGAGKEAVARTLHAMSRGRTGPFVVCTAESLNERGDPGRCSEAEWRDPLQPLTRARGGTLFVDEVGGASPEAQARLLRLLKRHQETRTSSLGKARHLDTRIVAATRQDLQTLSRVGQFQQELQQRLAVIALEVPALRERSEDLPGLAAHFLAVSAKERGRDVEGISAAAMERMAEHRWPGNVRELERYLDEAVLRSERSGARLLGEEHLGRFAEGEDAARKPSEGERLQEVIERHVMAVLMRCSGNKLRAAERLGISRSTLYRMIDAGAAFPGRSDLRRG